MVLLFILLLNPSKYIIEMMNWFHKSEMLLAIIVHNYSYFHYRSSSMEKTATIIIINTWWINLPMSCRIWLCVRWSEIELFKMIELLLVLVVKDVETIALFGDDAINEKHLILESEEKSVDVGIWFICTHSWYVNV